MEFYSFYHDETPVQVYFTSPTDFFLFESNANFELVADSSGSVVGLKINDELLKRLD
ncbi:hypothetical protein DI53_2540 [Sphingobacterium deserti]|uniref:Uncharacterized protein n=1 Tax=Sphingobacterium deserti TaxID=1229276 RepID=A0A0B8T6K5_9SPHI|nr:hypothetical protein DI53_2540 [Sphingobacterium deserti]